MWLGIENVTTACSAHVWLEELVKRPMQSQLQGLSLVAGVNEHMFIHIYNIVYGKVCMYIHMCLTCD